MINDVREPSTVLEAWNQWRNWFTARQVMNYGERLKVTSETTCRNCGRTFLAPPYTYNCSEACQDKSDYDGEQWRGTE